MGRDRSLLILAIVALSYATTVSPALAQNAAPASCPQVLDFDTDANGDPILAGQDLRYAYQGWGIEATVWETMAMTSYGTLIAFDSSNPTGNDWDLGTPNQAFGGPGVGSGGGPGPYQNDWEQGNLLIIAEDTVDANGDGYVDDPDDDAAGGWIEFFYDQPTCVFGTTIIDVDSNETSVDLQHFDANGNRIVWIDTPHTGGNGVVTVTYEYCGVDHSMFDLYSSGAFDDVQVCVGGTPEVCDGVDNDGDGDIDEGFVDADGDGSASCVDCDDNDANNYPGNSESCDNQDNDCDSDIDEGFDADGDGFSSCDGDCDDSDASVNPGADEDCDGVDNDCDGEVDELSHAVSAAQADSWNQYGWGHALVLPGIGSFVFTPDGQLQEHSDGTATLTGTLVNSSDSSQTFTADVTFTGSTAVPPPGSPKLELVAAAYVANGGPVDPATWHFYTDMTGTLTGGGSLAGASISVADIGPAFQVGTGANGKNAGFGASGWVQWTVDAQPSSTTLPAGTNGDWNVDLVTTCGEEVCDGLDNDGDGLIDEGFDQDNDGWTTCAGDCDDTNPNTNPDCPDVCNGIDDDCDGSIDEDFDQDGDGFTTCNGDCDDTDAAINPDAAEVCDGVDNDCDGDVDEGFDQDNDGWTTCAGDCDDTNPNTNPDCPDVCNGVDDDCDGSIDEDFDQDGDGYTSCNGDCDDTNAAVNPGATETCNGVDDDCDGATDEGFDADGDGYTACNGDCDDTDASVNPGATETCNGVDDDCDGDVDEGFDQDNDGWTTCAGDCDDTNPNTNPDCPDVCNGIDDDCDGSIDEDFDQDGDGYTTCNGDCDDTDAAVNPGATEVCDGIDNDCDGDIDEGFDQDNDGWTTCAGDCDDNNPNTNPDCPDICNGVDDDCDGSIDEDFDQDGDGVTSCDGDCDDTDPNNFTGNTEVCDGQDNDCDGDIDEGFDADGDGVTSCGGDCDDADPNNFPGNVEVCDLQDNDCDGDIDEEQDADGDGVTACGGDCDDADPNNFPGNPEVCDGEDNDCDGAVPVDELDGDGDGVTACDGDCAPGDGDVYPGADDVCNGQDDDCDGDIDEDGEDLDGDGFTCDDCDDTDATVYPGAPEACNGLDNDCDGVVDNGAGSSFDLGAATDYNVFVFEDLADAFDIGGKAAAGGDVDLQYFSVGHQNPGGAALVAGGDLTLDSGTVHGDAFYGGAATVTGSVNNIGGAIQAGTPIDFGAAEAALEATSAGLCTQASNGLTVVQPWNGIELYGSESDLNVFSVNGADLSSAVVLRIDAPAGSSVLINVSGTTVQSMSMGFTYLGVGAPDVLYNFCQATALNLEQVGFQGSVLAPHADVTFNNGNIDGQIIANSLVGTGEPHWVPFEGGLDTGACEEICDGLDNDGDGDIDEGFDMDSDGVTSCGGDCDDGNPNTYPGAPEICDGTDNDCDGALGGDEVDDDGDGYTECDGDCDDGSEPTNPSAPEVCDGVDNDCDGDTDEGYDEDEDGFTVCDGDCDDDDDEVHPGSTEQCNGQDDDCDGVVPADEVDGDGDGWSACDGDCDDANADVHPTAPEQCNGIDDDCDGVIPADEADADGDGVAECDGDCDDADADTFPGATELCDGDDNDCDGQVDWTEVDFDGDGYSNCEGDCDEYNSDINPGADEVCDGLDNDCDGLGDEGFDADSDGIPDCIDSCPQILTFDEDPWGNAINPGDDVTNAYAWWGVTVERFEDPAMTINTPVTAYDSANPLPGDEELGTPNVDFGGPGLGSGGGAGAPGENWREHANVMKTSDGNTWYIVSFNTATCVHAVQFIDVDEAELAAQVILFDVNVQTIDTITSSGLGDNSTDTLNLGGTCGVYVMMIDFYAKGAWDNLVICSDPNVEPEICDDGIDNDGDSLIDAEDYDCMTPSGDDDDDDSASTGDDDDAEDGDPNCSFADQRGSASGLMWLAFGLGLVGLRRRK